MLKSYSLIKLIHTDIKTQTKYRSESKPILAKIYFILSACSNFDLLPKNQKFFGAIAAKKCVGTANHSCTIRVN